MNKRPISKTGGSEPLILRDVLREATEKARLEQDRTRINMDEIIDDCENNDDGDPVCKCLNCEIQRRGI